MRIVHLCQSYPPMVSGAAHVVYRLTEGLLRRGHHVMVIAASDRGRGYCQEWGNLRLVRLRAFRNPLRVGQHFVLWSGRQILSELRAFQPDVVHLHDPLLYGLQGLLVARVLRRPIALTLHAMPSSALAYVPRLFGVRRLAEAAMWHYGQVFARRCQALIAPSDVVAQAVLAHGGQPHRISNGVDLEAFSPEPRVAGEAEALRHKYGLHPRLPVILHAGRLDIEKQVDVILRAAAPLLRAGRAQLVIAGDGTERRELRRLSQDLDIEPLVRFPGFVPAATDLPGLYRLASLFVMASNVEAQGIVVLEAAASGLPVVATDATSMPELVDDGVTGWLVPPGDEVAMAGRLQALLDDPVHARAMGQAGRAKVARQHSFERTLEAYEALYSSLLELPALTCVPH